MFILTKIADLVQIHPSDFTKKSLFAIEDNINEKYANKVIQKIGLCICLYDLIWASDGLIGHGDGLVNVNVEFRLLVFRPFYGEVISALITRADPSGIWVHTPFFKDIFVPHDELPEGAEFDRASDQWTWNVDDQRMYYDTHEAVRLRVINEVWHDHTPDKPIEVDAEGEEKREAPYTIHGSMKDAGLGVCIWWDG